MWRTGMFHLFSFCSLISISTSAYTISSYGKNYTLTFIPQQKGENVTAYAYFHTLELEDVQITMSIKSAMTWSSRQIQYTIPARSIMNITMEPFKGVMVNNSLWYIYKFGFESTSTFGLSVVMQEQHGYMSGFVALPNDYWSLGYSFPFYKSTRWETIIMIYLRDRVDSYCVGKPFHWGGQFASQFFMGFGSRNCHEKTDRFEVTVTGFYIDPPSKEFGLMAYNIMERFTGLPTCGNDERTAFSAEMVIPDDALGQEFITLYIKAVRGKIIIGAVYEDTLVTEHLGDSSFREYDLVQRREHVELDASPGPRRITTSEIVTVAYVMYGTCGQDRVSKGDLSMAVILPMELVYNNYFIGIPLRPQLEHFILIISPDDVMDKMILNYKILSVKWTPVIAANKWHFGEASLTEWKNRLMAEKSFLCYVYGIGLNKGYIYPAGYSSMGPMEDEFKEMLSSWGQWSCSKDCNETRMQRKRVCLYSYRDYNDVLCNDKRLLEEWKPGQCGGCEVAHTGIFTHWGEWQCTCYDTRMQRKRACLDNHRAKPDCRNEKMLTEWRPGQCGACKDDTVPENMLTQWSEWYYTNCSKTWMQRKRECLRNRPVKYDSQCREPRLLMQWKPGHCKKCSDAERDDIPVTNVVRMNPIKVTPLWRGWLDTSYNNERDNVTMECTYTGWKRMITVWSLNKVYQQHYLNTKDFLPELVNMSKHDGCRAYYHRSIKTVVLDVRLLNGTEPIFFCRAVNTRGGDTQATATMQFIIQEKSGLHYSRSHAASHIFGLKSVQLLFLCMFVIGLNSLL